MTPQETYKRIAFCSNCAQYFILTHRAGLVRGPRVRGAAPRRRAAAGVQQEDARAAALPPREHGAQERQEHDDHLKPGMKFLFPYTFFLLTSIHGVSVFEVVKDAEYFLRWTCLM